MAFDEIPLENQKRAIEVLIELKFNRILTKGGNYKNAFDGAENLKQLIKWANKQIIIMPGAGITSENYKEISVKLGVYELHGTKIVGKLN